MPESYLFGLGTKEITVLGLPAQADAYEAVALPCWPSFCESKTCLFMFFGSKRFWAYCLYVKKRLPPDKSTSPGKSTTKGS